MKKINTLSQQLKNMEKELQNQKTLTNKYRTANPSKIKSE